MQKKARAAAIFAGCVLAIACIGIFFASTEPKIHASTDTHKAEPTKNTAVEPEKESKRDKIPPMPPESDIEGRKKWIKEFTDFSKLNTKPVEDPGF